MARPTIFDRPMTDAERQAAWRKRKQNVLSAAITDSGTMAKELARRSRAISFGPEQPAAQAAHIPQLPQDDPDAALSYMEHELARRAAAQAPAQPDEIDELVAKGVREAQAAHQLLPKPPQPSVSEEQYVQTSLAASSVPISERERRQRAESYARWRYRGYCAGIVASL